MILKSGNYEDPGLIEYVTMLLQEKTLKSWTEGELKAYLNWEQFTLGNIINREYEMFFVGSSTTPTVADQTIYALPPEMIRLVGLEVADSTTDTEPQPLIEVPLKDREFYQALNKANLKREFGFFIVTDTNFRPMPLAGVSTKIIRAHTVQRLAKLVDDLDESRIPLEHHEVLATGASRRAEAKFKRRNDAIEALYVEGVELLKDGIRQRRVTREDRVQPWWGSSGPIWPWTPPDVGP